ncbi:MAG: nitroreductase family protein [Candidatus Hodarchaeales archaeon]|jgi:nitroreductase
MLNEVESKNVQNTSNDIFKIINNRRSIRKFTEKPITNDVLENILRAGIRAPFAAQLYSIIYTRDQEKMRKLKIGVYSSTQLLMIFLVDFRKIEKIINLRKYRYDYDDGMLLWLAIQDASLVAENVILASEAFGLGSVLLGGAPLQADLMNKVFNIPSRVFPVVGLCLGYPDKSAKTDVRPRYSLKFSAFEDSYQDLSESEILECMKNMDEGYITQGYYIKLKAKIPLKKGNDLIDYDKYSWSEHQSRKYSQGSWKKESLLSILKRHGFNLS